MDFEPEIVIEFTQDFKYLGLQYYPGDEIEMYTEEAESLIAQGVARRKDTDGNGQRVDS